MTSLQTPRQMAHVDGEALDFHLIPAPFELDGPGGSAQPGLPHLVANLEAKEQ